MHELKMSSEMGLLPTVLEHGRFRLPQFARLVASAVEREERAGGGGGGARHRWIASLLASSYWRIRGRADEAVRCLRRSLRRVPRHHAHYPLLSLANVLHRSRRSEDALRVLQQVEIERTNDRQHAFFSPTHLFFCFFSGPDSGFPGVRRRLRRLRQPCSPLQQGERPRHAHAV